MKVSLFLEYHRVLINTTKGAVRSRYDQTVKERVNLMNTTAENLLHRACTLITCCLDVNFENVASSSTTVCIGICLINRNAIDEALELSELAINDLQLAGSGVNTPELDGVVMTGDEAVACRIVELDILALLLKLGTGRAVCLGASFSHAPYNQLVAIPDSAK